MGSVKRIESTATKRAGKGVRYRADWRDPQGRKHAKTFTTKKEALHHIAMVEGETQVAVVRGRLQQQQ